MKTSVGGTFSLLMVLYFLIIGTANAQRLNDYEFKGSCDPLENAIRTKVQFNGYTNYWHNDYKEWIRYGNLFKMSIPNVGNNIAQSKIDIAEDLQVPGLSVQEGFLNGLFSGEYRLSLIHISEPTRLGMI